jgi:hypothetical protein
MTVQEGQDYFQRIVVVKQPHDNVENESSEEVLVRYQD